MGPSERLGTPATASRRRTVTRCEKQEASREKPARRMAKNSSNPVCANCHSMIAAGRGLPLEKLRRGGQVRVTRLHVQTIDGHAAALTGTKLTVSTAETGTGVQPDRFVTARDRELLSTDLGRGLETDDGPALAPLSRAGASVNIVLYLIVGIVTEAVPERLSDVRRSNIDDNQDGPSADSLIPAVWARRWRCRNSSRWCRPLTSQRRAMRFQGWVCGEQHVACRNGVRR